MWAFCGGAFRSGSTLQYQLTASIVEAAGAGRRIPWTPPQEMDSVFDNYQFPGIGVVKSHVPVQRIIDCVEDGFGVALYIHRDLRDVTISTMFHHKIPFDSVMESTTLNDCVQWGKVWEALPGVLIQRYDDLVSDMRQGVDQICEHLNVELPTKDKNEMITNHSIKLHRLRILAIPENQGWDSSELLHRNHIGPEDGKSLWRSILADFQIKQIENCYGGWLAEHGYESE